MFTQRLTPPPGESDRILEPRGRAPERPLPTRSLRDGFGWESVTTAANHLCAPGLGRLPDAMPEYAETRGARGSGYQVTRDTKVVATLYGTHETATDLKSHDCPANAVKDPVGIENGANG